MRYSLPFASLLVVAVMFAASPLWAAESQPLLWQIGTADDDTAEFALAPKGYERYGEDPMFIVGVSDPKRDWPYAHPGPQDSWAGNRSHTFTILFSLKAAPQSDCRLHVDLVDTHDAGPPELAVRINGGTPVVHKTSAGGPDDSIFGDPSKGREHTFDIPVPAASLTPGTNEISIATRSGSWVLYDCLAFAAPPGTQLTDVSKATLVVSADSPPVLRRPSGSAGDGDLQQTVELKIRHVGDPAEATVSIGDGNVHAVQLKPGMQTVELPVPAVQAETAASVKVQVNGKTIASREVTLMPVRKWVFYLLPHSHVDIGYTKVQTEVEKDHWRFIEQSIEVARRTAEYPPGARFKWNVEILWAVDSYLKQASPEKQQEFVEAVKNGWIGLDALYGNELTALCRPEELVRLIDYAGRISQRCGVTLDSAMISDVPGYTWGITSVLGSAGIKYLSAGPNSGHRIGFTHKVWDEKPFWWISPCGKHRVLCWIPERGYYRAFSAGEALLNRVRYLESSGYPYEIVQVRYCMGDNAGPAFELSEVVKEWNGQYAYPRLVIATTSEMMRAFDERHGDELPEFRGDFTPYWEDGAGSSSRETSLNRAAAERLAQAEALWAIRRPETYPDAEFYAAWRNAILYDEHTWGAYCSISQPESAFTRTQWHIKQSFALQADQQSRKLLAAAKQLGPGNAETSATFQVFNTNSWPRTDLVILSKDLSALGKSVKGPDGKDAHCQRLSDGRIAFVAREIPPLGAKRYTIEAGVPHLYPGVEIVGDRLKLQNTLLAIELGDHFGSIVELRVDDLDANFVDRSQALGLNDYFYVAGRDGKNRSRNGQAKITVKENGPALASFLVESNAPGCRRLTREIQVVVGLDRVFITNVVDKENVYDQEAVHFCFPFHVPEGVVRMDTPWAVVRPETDQLPGACKNYFTVQRWLDVSNDKFGVTLATIDAPLVEVGDITMDVPVPKGASGASWIERLEPSQTLYSYAMNNYWETNYKASQEGPTTFRYAVRPHKGGYDPVAAARFGIEQSQPLVVVPCGKNSVPAVLEPRLRVEPDEVIVTALKPAADGKGLIVRLFNVGETAAQARLTWSDPAPPEVFLSDPFERTGEAVTGTIDVPAMGLVTLRARVNP